MNWLEQYKPHQYVSLLDTMRAYRAEEITFSTFVDQLDATLDIWNKVTDEWDDPFLDKWSAVERAYEQNRARGPADAQADQSARDVIGELQPRIERVLEQAYYRRMLAAIADYEQGSMSLATLITDLEHLVNDLDVVPAPWHEPFRYDVWNIEYLESASYYWDSTAELAAQKRLKVGKTLERLKAMIPPLLATDAPAAGSA